MSEKYVDFFAWLIHVINSLRACDIQENLGKCIRSFQQLFILQRRKMQGDAKTHFVNCNFETLSRLFFIFNIRMQLIIYLRILQPLIKLQ